MKNLLFLALSVLVVSCSASRDGGEEQLSLNGDWKFYAIYGEGSNYMNTRVSDGDIVIDNRDSNVKTKGKWSIQKSGNRDSRFYGEDYLQHYFSLINAKGEVKEDDAYVRYYPNLKESGYYEAFTMYPFSSHLTAQYNMSHADGVSTRYLSQRVLCGEWNSLGIYEFDKDGDNYIEITAITNGGVAADAVMFKEILKEKYLQAKEEPGQVFLTDFDDSEWYDLKVPGHWGMINDYSNYTGIGWYRKSVELPASWTKEADQRYYLKFDGVYHLSKVYLNGRFIGKNRGGFTPFEFDVTDELNFDGKNILAVQADNSAIIGATWNWGGIIRDVFLLKSKDVRIDYQYAHADPDLETGKANLKLKVKLENNSAEKRSVALKAEVFDGAKIATMSASAELDPMSTEEVFLETSLKAKDVELWHFDHPKLYEVQTTVLEGGEVLSKLTDNFGIRKIELTDSKMLLNGEPVRLAGFNRVSESRFWGSSEPVEVLERDVDLMKEAGANFMRIMHGTQNKRLFDLCDRKGIMIFEEVNVRDLDNDEFRAAYYPLAKLEKELKVKLKAEDEEILMLDEPYVMLRKEHGVKLSEKNYFLSKYWLKGMIERDINHPCIIGWSVGNELNTHFEYGKATMAYVKEELDPYRLVTCVSNSGQKEDYTPKTDPNTFVDIIMHNMYGWQGKPQEILDALRTKWPDKPVFISEFGFDPFPSTGLDADKEVFSEWTNNYRGKNEFVVGTSMWTFNDYRSAYAGTTAEENRVWGVITTWRQKRRLFPRIQREHAPVKAIEITNIDFEKNSADIRMPVRAEDDYPSHTMRNYKLVYKFRNTSGEIVSEHALELPEIQPADKEWKGTISWKKLPSDILDLSVSLVTPTNYTRLDKTISFQPAITPEISEVIAGKNAVRILFEHVPNATEYFVSYTNEDGEVLESYKTVSTHIDVEGLQDNVNYEFSLFALNDKGASKPSKVQATTNQEILPPVIWDAFITDNKLVVGYSSDFDDGDYTVKYGSSKDNLDKEFSSNVRGMVSVDLDGEEELYFRLKREHGGEISSWSEVVEVK